MEHSEFHIGLEFYTASGCWRCTDVGSRVIVAISLEPHEIVTQVSDANGDMVQIRTVTTDPSWHAGLPYAVVEHVFDEYDLPVCFRDATERDHA
ncbi:MAG TPA: hypothetical protein VFM56_15345 [Solimonas sp.]|nr:hypothetical protein [Solimonas sp.]